MIIIFVDRKILRQIAAQYFSSLSLGGGSSSAEGSGGTQSRRQGRNKFRIGCRYGRWQLSGSNGYIKISITKFMMLRINFKDGLYSYVNNQSDGGD